MRTKQEVERAINKIIVSNRGKWSVQLNTLLWVLDLPREEDAWTRWQVSAHKNHRGADKFDWRMERMKAWIGSGKRLLDCGVHTGFYANELAKDNALIGIDLPEIIDAFKHKFTFSTVACDVNKGLQFADSSFDVVNAGEFVEHLLRPGGFAAEAYRVLVPGGVLVMSSPYNQDLMVDPTHCQVINEGTLTEFFGEFFVLEEKFIFTEENGNKGIMCRLRSRKGGSQ